MALFGFFGLTMLFNDPVRFSSPSFGSIRESGDKIDVSGVFGWGVILMVTAVVLALAPLGGTRVTRWAMTGGSVLYFTLAIFFFATAVSDPHASFWGAGWFVAMSAWLASQSIAQRELVKTTPGQVGEM